MLEARGHQLDRLRVRAFPFHSSVDELHRRPRLRVRGRAEPRRADALADRQRDAASTRCGSCRSCTMTARRSPRASSPRRSATISTSSKSRRCGRSCHDLHRQAEVPSSRRCRRTSSATPTATTRARSRRCAPAAATTRSPPRSSRPASSSRSSRTAWRRFPASAARRRRRTYFLGNSHGFNSVHGRMPSVLTGANLANRDLIYLGVSGDGDSRLDRLRPVRALRSGAASTWSISSRTTACTA